MKKLPFHRRPWFAQRVLEVGGGHEPYLGVTHAVDKFPTNNFHRGGDLKLPKGVQFYQGDLEALPFPETEKPFSFVYASHVFEHVTQPEKAVKELNRMGTAGYLETPSPLREQMACQVPFLPGEDIHQLFVWAGSSGNQVNVIKKRDDVLLKFCSCPNGRRAKYIVHVHRKKGVDLEPMLPGTSKATTVFWNKKLDLRVFENFDQACRSGECAYRSVSQVQFWIRFPFVKFSKRFERLKTVLAQNWDEYFGLPSLPRGEWKNSLKLPRVAFLCYAKLCGGSRVISKTLDSVREDVGFPVFGLDVDEHTDFVEEFSIQMTPTLLFFENGEQRQRLEGNHRAGVILEKLASSG